MDIAAPAASVSPAALQASAGDLLWPAPDWLKAAKERYGDVGLLEAWQRAARVPGAWFDHAKADAVVALWPKLFRLTEDRFYGKPFRLSLWQEAIVRLLVGWKTPIEIVDEDSGEIRDEQVRLFKCLRLWVPRKNGKSEFLAALALLFFLLEGTYGGQGYCFARDEKQAKVPFDKMKTMLALAPQFATRHQAFAKSIWVPQIRGRFELLSGKPEGKHGRSPTVILGDEMHEWVSRELADVLRQGTGARLQPIELYASTAGVKSNAVGYGLWQESLGTLEGRLDDPSTLIVIFAADPEADYRDETAIRRANPSLGLSPTMAFLQREMALAADNPRAEAHFRCYHLNQWIDAVTRWLSIKRWDLNTQNPTAWRDLGERLKGRKCFGALDVSAVQDITALLWLFPPEEAGERIHLVCRFWVPEETIRLRSRRDRVSYDKWLEIGALEATPGDAVDQSYVQKAVEQGFADYDVQRIGYDPWNARKLVADLQKDGIDPDKIIEMRQGIPTLGGASKTFERLVYATAFEHGGHPVLRWMAGNAVVRFDENLNYAPAKKRSTEKIDGVTCAVMGCGLAFEGQEDAMDLDGFLANPVMVV